MDLNTITEVVRRPADRPGAEWRPGDAWLAGGTWLFSDQQPDLRRLIDLMPLGWDTVDVGPAGLTIGAMATIHQLYELAAPDGWLATPLIRTSCEAFLASFKVWNSATVGGNICMSLPAGPMITLTVALEATYTLWAPDGSERVVDAADFVTGNHENILTPGELLREIHIPVTALQKRHAHRRFELTHLGRSTIFMIATQSPNTEDMLLTITAGTTHRFACASTACPMPTRCSTASTPSPTMCGSTTRTAHPITAATSRSITRRRSGPNWRGAGDDVHRERQEVQPRAASWPMPAHLRARPWALRRQKGLRRR